MRAGFHNFSGLNRVKIKKSSQSLVNEGRFPQGGTQLERVIQMLSQSLVNEGRFPRVFVPNVGKSMVDVVAIPR